MIEIATRKSEGNWIFTIADNGIGVPVAYEETIFGIFRRLHTENKYSGTGMGLAICKRIVERYRGQIWMESEPGEGAKFSFDVPELNATVVARSYSALRGKHIAALSANRRSEPQELSWYRIHASDRCEGE